MLVQTSAYVAVSPETSKGLILPIFPLVTFVVKKAVTVVVKPIYTQKVAYSRFFLNNPLNNTLNDDDSDTNDDSI